MRDACGATGRANAAHYAVEGLLCTFFILTALCVRYVLHNVKLLRAGLGAGVASNAGVYFGVELHHYLLGGLYLFDIVYLLDKREERQSCDIHTVLYLSFAGKADLEVAVALDAIDGSASAAKAVAASTASYKLIARVFHSAHNGKI
jgi:hypothetical protein